VRRIHVLFFISLAMRRLEFIACTQNPDGAWVAQQARNLVPELGEQGRRFRDTKFSRDFDEVFRSEGIEVIRTPVRAPNANAFAERWVGLSAATASIASSSSDADTSTESCVSTHYNEHRPHRALKLTPPDGGKGVATDQTFDVSTVHRHDLLGGLIHEYRQAA
jgi:putative transposase